MLNIVYELCAFYLTVCFPKCFSIIKKKFKCTVIKKEQFQDMPLVLFVQVCIKGCNSYTIFLFLENTTA